jgi:hypothetical protein
MNGFAGPEKSLIIPFFTLEITILTVADTIFLTNLQKRENRRNGPPSNNIKMQVA